MNVLTQWLAPDVLRALGLALSHFLWQGAAMAALAAGGMAVARQASSRYLIALAALVAMVAAPLITFAILYRPAVPDASIWVTSGVPRPMSLTATLPPERAAAQPASPFSPTALDWLVTVWFAGVFIFSLRTAGGFFLIARLRRRDCDPVAEELLLLCHDLQRRLGITRAVRFCESLYLDAPAVIGWLRPVVFLPVSALTGLSETQLSAVIVHELAHIRRLDGLVNLFQVAAETLLFYHPGVWWLSKRIRAERENCCDDVALTVCPSPAEYARALALMEEWRVAPALAMALNRGPLASRVARLLGLGEKGSALRNAGLAFGMLCVLTALLAGNALVGIVRPVSAHPSLVLQAPAAPEDSQPVVTVTASRAAQQSKPGTKPAERSSAAEESPAPAKQSYIDGMKAEGFDNLSADELISMKVQGITPQYVHQIRAEGLKPSINDLVAMKVQGITPEYIHQMRALQLRADVDALIGMKVQGITPEYVEEIRKMGFRPDTEQLIGMKVQGISPEYVKQINDLGFHPDAEDLVGMKVQGIDAEYIRSIRSTGLNPDKDDLMGLKVQGVSADYIKALQAAGFKPDIEDVISAKTMGITPEFIKQAQSHGFKNLDLHKIIQLREAGVLE
jgi:beta-lactamase regulating signal transducer with metallopeptidase domain